MRGDNVWRSLWDWCREPLMRRINTLRSPYLVATTGTLFVIDLFFPGMIPWAGEILLGLATVTLARIRRKPPPRTTDGADDDAA